MSYMCINSGYLSDHWPIIIPKKAEKRKILETLTAAVTNALLAKKFAWIIITLRNPTYRDDFPDNF